MQTPPFPHVLVGGTNGKGSVCRITADILSKSGKKTGLFLTPHLLRVQERISIDGKEITGSDLLKIHQELEASLKSFYQAGHRALSFFESMLLVAIAYFQREAVDIAVFEVGLGGHRDACAALKPCLSMVTNISEDHLHILGPTLEDVCRNKAGLIFANTPFYYGADDEFRTIFQEECKHKNAAFLPHQNFLRNQKAGVDGLRGEMKWEGQWHDFLLSLRGEVQSENLNSSLVLCSHLPRVLRPSAAQIQKALGKVKHPCRLEKFHENPLIFVDGSHNLAGIHSLLSWLRKTVGKNNVLLAMSIKENKDHQRIARLLKGWNLLIFRPSGPGFLSLSKAKKLYLEAQTKSSLSQVLDHFFRINNRKKCLVFFGSLKGSAKTREILPSLMRK